MIKLTFWHLMSAVITIALVALLIAIGFLEDEWHLIVIGGVLLLAIIPMVGLVCDVAAANDRSKGK